MLRALRVLRALCVVRVVRVLRFAAVLFLAALRRVELRCERGRRDVALEGAVAVAHAGALVGDDGSVGRLGEEPARPHHAGQRARGLHRRADEHVRVGDVIDQGGGADVRGGGGGCERDEAARARKRLGEGVVLAHRPERVEKGLLVERDAFAQQPAQHHGEGVEPRGARDDVGREEGGQLGVGAAREHRCDDRAAGRA
eukprot:23352-Pleurochrysis_carterae.AAC.2